MAVTKRSDLIYVDQLQEAVQAYFLGKKALWGTGVAVQNSTLPSIGPDGSKLKGGDTIRVPYFDPIGELEDVTEAQALTPAKLTETSETATVTHSGKAGEITAWAQLTAQFSDPYAELARQFGDAWMRRIDKGLIDKAVLTTLTNDLSGNTGAAALISLDGIFDTAQKWNDEQPDNPSEMLLVLHSKVYGDARKLKDTDGRPLFTDPTVDFPLPRMAGIPVKVSDRITVTGSGANSAVYTNLLCKRSAMAAWVNGTPEILQGTDILSHSQITALHTYWVTHLYKRPSNGSLPGVIGFKTKASA
jgi:hypothetical protein